MIHIDKITTWKPTSFEYEYEWNHVLYLGKILRDKESGCWVATMTKDGSPHFYHCYTTLAQAKRDIHDVIEKEVCLNIDKRK